jgi:hypothetical protein
MPREVIHVDNMGELGDAEHVDMKRIVDLCEEIDKLEQEEGM